MGSVDLVVQVESPGAVSRGLQRIGRAGHSVGEPSRGTVYPKHRGDLLEAAVVARRMRDGLVETTRFLRNPLDVLAQQIVSMCSAEDWTVAELEALLQKKGYDVTALESPIVATQKLAQNPKRTRNMAAATMTKRHLCNGIRRPATNKLVPPSR